MRVKPIKSRFLHMFVGYYTFSAFGHQRLIVLHSNYASLLFIPGFFPRPNFGLVLSCFQNK